MPDPSKILVVDDDPDIHHLLAAALSNANYLIEDRYDGLEALSFLETQPCDLVITDVRMPGLNGLELLRRIRQVRPGTKVLVMTAESTPATVISSLRDQASGYFGMRTEMRSFKISATNRAHSWPIARRSLVSIWLIPTEVTVPECVFGSWIAKPY